MTVRQRPHHGEHVDTRREGAALLMRVARARGARKPVQHGGGCITGKRQLGRRRGLALRHSRNPAIGVVAFDHPAIGVGDRPGDISLGGGLRHPPGLHRSASPRQKQEKKECSPKGQSANQHQTGPSA